MREYKNWIQKDGVALCLIPKNGSTSFRNCLATSTTMNDLEVMEYGVRVAFVRNPIKRLMSAYTFFYYLNESEQNGQPLQVPKDVTHNGYETWIDFILQDLETEEPNLHWKPQFDIIGNIPTHLYKFKRKSINKYWHKHWTGKLPDFINQTGTHLMGTDYKSKEIEQAYSMDIRIYKSIGVE